MIWMFIFMALPLLGSAYLSWHLWTLLPLPTFWRCVLIVLLVGSFLLLFLNFGRRFDTLLMPLATACYEVSTSSLFVMLYLVIVFLVLDLGRLVRLVPRSWLYQNGWTAAAIAVFIVAIFVYGNLHYNNKVRVELDLPTQKQLARDYRIVMLSDLHIGYHNTRAELSRWVDIINSEKPDYVLIAGDIIDMSMRPLIEERMADEFHRIKAPVYACLGNHEFFSGESQAQQFYKDAGIRLLRDTCEVTGDLCIIGRDDRLHFHRKAAAKIFGEADHTKYTIVMDHQPHHLEQAENAGIDFQVSGQTHRGQVWPISWITDHIYECSHGEYQRGNTRYYVSSGIGIWGGKFRIGTQSEYVVAEISHRD